LLYVTCVQQRRGVPLFAGSRIMSSRATTGPNPPLLGPYGVQSGTDSTESTCTVLTCFPEEFQDFFDDETLLTSLSDDTLRVHNIIRPKSDFRLYAQATADITSSSYAPFKSTHHTLGEMIRRNVSLRSISKAEDGHAFAALSH